MSLNSKAWSVATSMAAVEALKDQLGFCWWNHTLTSLHHHARSNLKSLAQDAKKYTPPDPISCRWPAAWLGWGRWLQIYASSVLPRRSSALSPSPTSSNVGLDLVSHIPHQQPAYLARAIFDGVLRFGLSLQSDNHLCSIPFSAQIIAVDGVQKKTHADAVENKETEEKKELELEVAFVEPPPNSFPAPRTNAFGQTFRDYEAQSERQSGAENFYRVNHINQSVDFVRRMREEYGKLNRVEMSIWECCELLNDVVDESDPDLDEPQIEHLLQTAEAIRKDYPDEGWLHLTGLIHDLGKVLNLPVFGDLPQWAVVGDTYPVGCAFDESIVHHKYFAQNSDYNNPAYNTSNGIYSEGCGLENVLMSWGHDDYMYLVAKGNKTSLPSAALFIIRFHSFYALHRSGAYKHLMNDEDVENLKWLQIFNKYDLYSKSKVRIDVEKVKPYYLSLISKYFPSKLKW